MPIPKIIHFVHLGSFPLPEYVEIARDKNPDFTVKVWNEGNLHELSLNIYDIHHGSYAGKSNVIRLHAIYKIGGIYIDTDVECLRPMNEWCQYKAFAAMQIDGIICNAVFGAEQYHPWIHRQIRFASRFKHWDAGWGPKLMTSCMLPKDKVTMIDPYLCYPYSWDTPDSERKPDSRSIVEHKWAKSWILNP